MPTDKARKEYEEALKAQKANPHNKDAAKRVLRARKRLNQAYASQAD